MMKKKKSNRCLIVAEVSANHGRDLKRAVAMIRKAKECGADAVKFQTYTPDTLTIDSDRSFFRVKHPKWKGQTLYQLYGKACTPWEWFAKLKKTSDSEGIMFFATAFDKTSVDLLEKLKVPVHKIASFELVDLPLIRYAAKTGKPMIISTGMATKSEIKEAVDAARKAGAKDITLLKCVSSYPADPREMNLLTLRDMRESFGCPVGLSDHSMGIGASIAAVALGATVIEKQFTLSRKIRTPDSFFSIEPDELERLVRNARIAEEAVGRVHYGLTEDEKKSKVFRRSLFAVKDIRKGEVLNDENVRSVRPANGLAPKYLKSISGKKAKKTIKKGTPLGWDLID